METLRTPDDRFVDLPDFAFAPNYAEVDDSDAGSLRVHYLDEGPSGAPPIVLLHGEPTWSYLYRHMIGPLTAAGHRVIVPDLVGFGRSDKPVERSDTPIPALSAGCGSCSSTTLPSMRCWLWVHQLAADSAVASLSGA